MSGIVIDKLGAANRIPITISILLATVMSSIDSTIANVALPHIQGSVSASADQITWVLTSYIVAAAILTPLSGFLADRFGRKLVMLTSISGFVAVSMLCGLADSLPQIVAFRLLQGVFGASLIPLSQAILLDINPPERHGQAMALWGAGAVVGPIIGPLLGGWLTEHLSWRWVFFINLPVGLLAIAGMFFFLSESKASERTRFDFLGFSSLALAIAGLQLMLDRGPSQDWFASPEIWTYLIVGVISLWVFCVQIATAKNPFINKALLTDLNFINGSLLGFVIGMLLFSSLSLLPSMMQNLYGYPVSFTGMVTMPRGLGSLITMGLGGWLLERLPIKSLLWSGLVFCLISSWTMTQINLQMDSTLFIVSGFIQGIGTGLMFVPLTSVAFATVRPEHRSQGAGLFTLIRNLGASAGIAIMQARLADGVQINHANLVEHVRPDNPTAHAYLSAPLGFDSPQALAALNGVVVRQATMLSYVQVFQFLLGLSLLCAPLILFARTPKRTRDAVHVAID